MDQSILQSVIIPKKIMTRKQAIDYVKLHFKYKKIEETENNYRFKQLSPEYLKKIGYNKYYTKTQDSGIKLVFAFC